MKMIKLQPDHYIIVDDSEINEGDFFYDFHNQEICQSHFTKLPIEFGNCKYITRSTDINWNEVYYIPLSEVRELIGEVDVEKKAAKELESYFGSNLELTDRGKDWVNGYTIGYNQCLEDNKDKKYTEEDMRKVWNAAYIDAMSIDEETYKPLFFEDFMQSLQPQTEWEVEFDEHGKLKLK